MIHYLFGRKSLDCTQFKYLLAGALNTLEKEAYRLTVEQAYVEFMIFQGPVVHHGIPVKVESYVWREK